VQDVSNYVAAMTHGLRRLREDFPLSLRLIREIHKILLSKGRGSQKRPGEFGVCSATTRENDGVLGCAGKVPTSRTRRLADLGKDSPRSRTVRNDSPVPGWKRKTWSLADYILAVRRRG